MNDLIDAMRNSGLNPPPSVLNGPTGVFLRFSTNGKKNDKAGWLKIFPNRRGATFGDMRTNMVSGWQAGRDPGLSEADFSELLKQESEQRVEAERQREAAYALTAVNAQRKIEACKEADPLHPYLAARNIAPSGALQDDLGNLVIPVLNIKNEVQSYQTISYNLKKSNAPGGKMTGGMYWLRDGTETIFIGEGFATMASVAAATPSGGVVCCFSAGQMLNVAHAIRGKYPKAKIVLCGDNDSGSKTGQKAAESAAEAVGGIPVIPHDPGDWNELSTRSGIDAVWAEIEEAMNEYEEELEIARAAEEAAENVTPGEDDDEEEDERTHDCSPCNQRPVLQIRAGAWPELIKTVIQRLADEREVFDMGNTMVRIDRHGRTFPVTPHALLTPVERLYKLKKLDGRIGKYVATKLPLEFAQRIISSREAWIFPTLRGMTSHRVIRPDGSLLEQPGYDEQTELYLHKCDEWAPIPTDIKAAIHTLWYPLSEMPFASPADASAAFSLLLTAVQRPVLPLAPMFLTSAPDFSSGKTLIAEVASHLAGGNGGVSGFTHDDDEMNKRIISALLMGDPCIILDNASGQITGDSLAKALTALTYTGRLLGTNTNVALPTRTLWLATGVNIAPSADMVRRVLTIRVDPKCERPDLRQFDFHPVDWTKAHLAEMQAAALKIIQYAKPRDVGNFGSLNEWNHTIRSVVLTLIEEGLMPCPMDDPLEVVGRERTTDPEIEELSAILHGWHAVVGERFITLRELIDKALSESDTELLGALDAVSGNGKGTPNPRKLGKYLRRHENRIVEGLQIEKGRETRVGVNWKVKSAGLAGFIDDFSLQEGSVNNIIKNKNSNYCEKYIRGEKESRNSPNPQPCPRCSGEGCDWCHDTGVFS